MSKSIDLDKAGECLRNILDNNRCGNCDKFGSKYWRCVHGHIVCNDCSVKEDGCLTCFATFNSPVLNNTWVLDKCQSEKVKNALDLLSTFQDTFKTDVYKRQRISDQLKAEKELFPDCIQAPIKYSNKRKSLKSTICNKENSQQSFYFGKEISPQSTLKMEKSKYIQHWLESATGKPARKPFANINVNNQRLLVVNEVKNKSLHKSNITKKSTIRKPKLSFSKKHSSIQQPKKSLECVLKTSKNTLNTSTTLKDHLRLHNKSKINDDSGIVMDEECTIIEDTPNKIVDKDELALRAVHEAARNEDSDEHSLHDDTDFKYRIEKYDTMKVPFQKKGLLYISCPSCKTDAQIHGHNQGQPIKNISITIEYGSKDQVNLNKQSMAVQTEISEINNAVNTTEIIYSNDKYDQLAQKSISIDTKRNESRDIFLENMDVYSQNKGLVIDESDTDIEPEHIQVSAVVHRTCQAKDYDILSEIALTEIANRKRRIQRGMTPGSTDSSDKENFDPNRVKRSKCMKKGKKKPNKS